MATVGLPPRPPPIPQPSEDADDEKLISQLISGDPNGESINFDDFGDTVGKAEDAVDYEDISDDDLPSDEELPELISKSTNGDGDEEDMEMGGDLLAGMADEPGMDDYDDLFGPMDPASDPAGPGDMSLDDVDISNAMDFDYDASAAAGVDTTVQSGEQQASDLFRSIDFGQDAQLGGVPAQAPLTPQELAMQLYPQFKPNAILSMVELFEPKPGTLGRGPQKTPKVCVPTKINIEMAPDDLNAFNKTGPPKVNAAARSGIVVMAPEEEEVQGEEGKEQETQEDEGMDPMFKRDLEIACEDWDSKIEAASLTPPPSPNPARRPRENDDAEYDIISPDTFKVCISGPRVGICAKYAETETQQHGHPVPRHAARFVVGRRGHFRRRSFGIGISSHTRSERPSSVD